MKTRYKILIIIGVVIGGLILYGALSTYIQNYNYEINKTEYLENQPTISVTGIIQHWSPIDGPSYSIIPEEDIDFEINERRGIFLYGQLSPSLEGKRVTVSGILIENYVDFQLKTLGGAFGGDPNTAVILVEDVISSEPEPEPEQNPIPESYNGTSQDVESDKEDFISPFNEELIHEFQEKYDTVITGMVLQWQGHKQPSKYEYQYEVKPLAYHTPNTLGEDDPIYTLLGYSDTFSLDGQVYLFGLSIDDEGLYKIEERIQLENEN